VTENLGNPVREPGEGGLPGAHRVPPALVKPGVPAGVDAEVLRTGFRRRRDKRQQPLGGWIGSYLPLEVPTFFGSSVFSTFLLRQFFMTIPQSLSDAARIDGASEFYIYRRIILPLAKPALATVILFQFIYCWNDYLGPLIYISNQSSYPLSLGLDLILGDYSTNWAWVMAGATAATAPIVILFFLTQRTFIQGIALTGTKG
jgi:multiple sugar transport system permease protein